MRILLKEVQGLKMQKMKVIELSKFKRSKASFFGTQPYTMCFCYPKSGPVIVKGMAGEVEKYVDNRLGPCHYRYVYFKDGKILDQTIGATTKAKIEEKLNSLI